MLYFFISMAIIILDQASKFLVRSKMSLFESRAIINNVFHFTYIENPGAAFGILAEKRLFFLLTTFVICGLIIYFMKLMEEENPFLNYFLAMALGGAIGNFIDRAIKGTVTDFLDFRIWPVFNIADIFIVVGMLSTAFYLLIGDKEKGDINEE